jgi:hypothetical protein
MSSTIYGQLSASQVNSFLQVLQLLPKTKMAVSHAITEILLKVALNTKYPNLYSLFLPVSLDCSFLIVLFSLTFIF